MSIPTEQNHNDVTEVFAAVEHVFGVPPWKLSNADYYRDNHTIKAREAAVFAIRQISSMPWKTITLLLIGRTDTSVLRMYYSRAKRELGSRQIDRIYEVLARVGVSGDVPGLEVVSDE